MDEIIYTINRLNGDYVLGTGEYKTTMREYVKSISVDSKFSLSEFLSDDNCFVGEKRYLFYLYWKNYVILMMKYI